MIVNLKKYLFIGAKEELDPFFERAQNQGFLEFISITHKKSLEKPKEVQNLILAHKILRKLPVKEPYEQGGDLNFAQEIAGRIIHLKREIERFDEQRRLVEAEIARVGVFGDFSMSDLDYIEQHTDRVFQFFCMKSAKAKEHDLPEHFIYVGSELDLDYFVSIHTKQEPYKGMIELRIDRPLGELQNQLEAIDEGLAQMEKELKALAGYSDFLQDALIEELDHFHLSAAKEDVEYPLGSLFAIEAWVPQNKMGALYGLMDNMAIHCEPIAIEKSDRVPTCMQNKGSARIGEDLVQIYDAPSTEDKDPSLWVLISFTLFFAIIISDAGYGLIYLATALFLKWKFPKIHGMAKRLLQLFTILASGCIVWGVLSSSYFGINISPNSPLGKISFVNYLAKKKVDYTEKTSHRELEFAKEEMSTSREIKYETLTEETRSVILELSLVIGVVHVSLGLLRYLRRNFAAVGWVVFLVGGYLYFPSLLKATSLVHALGWIDPEKATYLGKQMLIAGFSGALLLSLIQNKWRGLQEIANLVQIFADVLSYLRLYALALASAIMAETFNGIGAYIGLFAGMIALVVGHMANLVLGTGSGVIHGLRLNFIEWYHYSFVGGGRMFNPLAKLRKMKN